MRRVALLLASVFVFLTPTLARADCAIVYGQYWAFSFSTPVKWSSLCNAEKQLGVPLAFWQEGSNFANSSAVMYVTVSGKDKLTLSDFVTVSQNKFREQAPSVKFVALDEKSGTGKFHSVQYSATGDPGGNSERIYYLEGAASYFVVVLSARNPKALELATPAFRALLESFVPMSAKIEK